MIKQVLSLLLALTLMLCLASCGGGKQSAQQTTATEEVKTEVAEPEEVAEDEPAAEEPVSEEAEEEVPVAEEPEAEDAGEGPVSEEQLEAEEEDPAYTLYNKFIEDLKSGGVVEDVDDSGGPVDGMWILYVNDNWKALSTAQKQALADSVLGQIVPWADGMYGISCATYHFRGSEWEHRGTIQFLSLCNDCKVTINSRQRRIRQKRPGGRLNHRVLLSCRIPFPPAVPIPLLQAPGPRQVPLVRARVMRCKHAGAYGPPGPPGYPADSLAFALCSYGLSLPLSPSCRMAFFMR